MPPCRRHGVGIVYGYHTRAVYCYRNGLDFGERPGEYGSVLQGCAGVRLHRLAGRRPGVDEWRGQRRRIVVLGSGVVVAVKSVAALTRLVVERNRVRRTGQRMVGGEGWKWPVRRTRARQSRAKLMQWIV